MERIENIIRKQVPGKAAKADSGQSPVGSIRLHCRSCSGDVPVNQCPIYTCFLWPYRTKNPGERPAGIVPTPEEYEQMVREKFGEKRWAELKSRKHFGPKK